LIETVIVGGLATDFCMKTTALQLREAGFRVIVNLGACRSVNLASLEDDLEQMHNAGIETIQSANELETSV
jgi:nicotinamidase/pyrazinamidase